MTLKKAAFSAILLSVSIYILLPTPDELVIYPVLSFFFAYGFHIPIIYGLLISMILYRGVGCACLLGALLIGGKPIYYSLKQRIAKKRVEYHKF